MKKEHNSNKLTRRKFLSLSSLLTGSLAVNPFKDAFARKSNSSGINEKLNVKKEGGNFIIESPFFAFCLDTSDGLKGVYWLNKLTNRKLNLGNGDEVGFSTGLPESKIIKPKLKVVQTPKTGGQPLGEAVFVLRGDEVNALLTVTYSWNGNEPVLTKVMDIVNEGTIEWNRLLDIHLGTYATDATPYKDPDWPVIVNKTPWGDTNLEYWENPSGKTRGYPAYPENQFFVGLAHPSGFSLLNDQKIELHHHPGILIKPKEGFTSVQTIYGAANKGEARDGFKRHIYSRMRRVLRGHDHPYAIIDTCGAQNNTDEKFDNVTEEWSLQHISKLSQAQKEAGLHFDNYVVEFWHDTKGDLKQCDPKRFPNDFDKIAPSLNKIGTNLGLWISSGCQTHPETMDQWTIGANPVLKNCSTTGNGKGRICRSTAPANQIYIDGLIYQIRTNHIRQIKLDCAGDNNHYLTPWCNNSSHTHLTGDLYSIEANQNAQIQLLSALNKECPDVFFTLYWGHHSPWWLMHADTVYDIGFKMEMASLALSPALYGRSSNVRRLDQGKYLAAKDYPDLAWDSLGIALSDWKWNNRLGSDKWQEGVLMDICRGSMLLHIWSDNDCIPLKDRPQMAEFINLLKASPGCFRNPHMLGNPFKDNWWGYCCTDGKKAFIAIDNGSWDDQLINLELNSSWGLPDDVEWDIYCWYPHHIKFEASTKKTFVAKEQIIIRPFTALLLEVVPHGRKPSIKDIDWKESEMPVRFLKRSQAVEVTSAISRTEKGIEFAVNGILPSQKVKGWLAVTTEFIKNGKPAFSLENKPLSMKGSIDGKNIEFAAALDNPLFPAVWQTYRYLADEDASGKEFSLSCVTNLKKEIEIVIKAYFIPLDKEI